MRIAFATLGCKINQYETDVLRQDLAARGNSIVPFDSEADIYVVNTCSVTAKSDAQCRHMIRIAARRGPGAKVVVTGCYAETRPEELRNLPGVSLVIGNRDKAAIPHQLMTYFTAAVTDHASSLTLHKPPPNLPYPTEGRGDARSGEATAATAAERGGAVQAVKSRTRGFLKIQDGCNNRCSYCIVPLARGGSKSAAPEAVIGEFDRLAGEGCPEIVLTGIHIGSYGAELSPRMSLTDLLTTLTARRIGTRIRISSIEPRELTQGIIDLLGNGVCRHLHIPLQSGDDSILASMKRDYTAAFYLELLERIAREAPGIALGADVMVGYPGEGEREFQNTMHLVADAPLTHLHVFSYSPRPGTPAADMKGQVTETIKKERSEELRRLGQEKNYAFRKKQEGNRLTVVVENKVDPKTGFLSGLTDNYIRVMIDKAGKDQIGQKIPVRITEVKNDVNFVTTL